MGFRVLQVARRRAGCVQVQCCVLIAQTNPQRVKSRRPFRSPTDALIDLKVRCRLCCLIPVRPSLNAHIVRRILGPQAMSGYGCITPLLFRPVRNGGGGITITKQLVDMMQGMIMLQSTQGVGSTFSVDRPFETIDQVLKPNAASAVSKGTPRLDARVLVAEDILTNQIVARGLLKKLGYHDVVIVSDGAQAVQAVQSQHFDIVLMDCQMPVMDGYLATVRLRELGFELPVVAMTANAMPGDREKSLAAGMNDHVDKPIRLNALQAAMDRWLSATS